MDNTVLYCMMIAVAILMAMLPFAVFMGLATMFDIDLSDWRILVTYIIVSVVIVYALSLGAFALMQKNNCDKINMSQIAQNAAISAAFQAGMLLMVCLIPWFRNVVMKLLPPDVDLKVRASVGLSYYSFWAALFGIAVGGSLSAACGSPVDTPAPTAPTTAPTAPTTAPTAPTTAPTNAPAAAA